jgi:hypothetical protein
VKRRTAPLDERRLQMRFMVSLITDGTYMEEATPKQMEEMAGEMSRFMGELQEAAVLVHTGRLAPSTSAMTLRYGEQGKPVVTDGPFAESKEQVAGYMVLECGDLDEAVTWVERLPVRGGAVEVRAIADSADEDFEARTEAARKS